MVTPAAEEKDLARAMEGVAISQEQYNTALACLVDNAPADFNATAAVDVTLNEDGSTTVTLTVNQPPRTEVPDMPMTFGVLKAVASADLASVVLDVVASHLSKATDDTMAKMREAIR